MRPSSLFKEKLHQRYKNNYNFLMKRTEDAYDELKRTKLVGLYGASKEKEVEQVLDNLKSIETKENAAINK